ncbi:hypothetical protein EVG20_g6086 [Dentipellis fragilis]|uniref:HMG box domain-containing protein n=1 Tax=Dentipellis fragilis TaxID=205917 RepID=A0A4Y9YNJ5_9AGAM|nr:hypothetical protein EVG20_g6086 [Dentipellis fragilis]
MSNTTYTTRSTSALSLSSSNYHHPSRTSLHSRPPLRFSVAMAPPSTPLRASHPMDATFVAVNPAPAPRQPAQSSSKSTGKSAEPKPPRPRNAWILYRSDKIRQLPPREDGRSRTQAEVSQLISKMWAEVSPEERADYEARADRAKAEHMKKWPDYKYAPVKKEVKEQEKLKRKLEKEQERAESGPNQRRKTSPYSEPGPVSAGSRGPSPPMSSASTDSSPELVTRQLSAEAGPSHAQEPPQLPTTSLQSPSQFPSLPYPVSTPHLEMPQGSHVPAAVMMIHPGYAQHQYTQPYASASLAASAPAATTGPATTETSYVPPQNASQNASFRVPQVPAPAVETESEAFAHDSFTALLGSTGDGSVFQVQLNTDSQDFSEPPAELNLNFDLGSLQSNEPFNESVSQWASFFAPQDEAEASTGLDTDMWKRLWEAAEPGLEAGATYSGNENTYQAGEGVFQPSTGVAQGRSGSAQSQDMMDFLNLDPPFSASSHDGSFGNSVGMSQGSSTAPQAVQYSSHSSSPEPRREYHPPSGAANAGSSTSFASFHVTIYIIFPTICNVLSCIVSCTFHYALLFSSLSRFRSGWDPSLLFTPPFAPVAVAVDPVDSLRFAPRPDRSRVRSAYIRGASGQNPSHARCFVLLFLYATSAFYLLSYSLVSFCSIYPHAHSPFLFTLT